VPGQSRTERIVLETARYRITGEVTLPAEGSRSRLSDLLNREGLSFIPLSNAEITSHDDGQGERISFIAVARDHVQIAYEDG
jgi:uncharacterized protein DUF6812